MQQFEFVFEALPFSDENIARVKRVLTEEAQTRFTFQRHPSGCVSAVAQLPSVREYLVFQVAFGSKGFMK